MRELEFRVDGLTEEQVRQWRPRKPPRRISGIAIAAASLLAIALYSRTPASPIVGVVPGIDFGEQSIQETGGVQAVTIVNRGSAKLVITRIVIEGAQPNAFVLDSNSCGAAGIAPRQSCAVEVRFTSRSPGNRLAQLVITDNAFDSPQRVALSGTVVPPGPPRARITPTPVEFGSPQVRATAQGKVTVENVGTTPLLVRRVAVRGTSEFTIIGENCTHQPIGLRGVCTVELRFAPQGSGARRAQLVVSDNTAGSPQLVPLSGRGMDLTPPAVPRMRITPSPVDFGTPKSARPESRQVSRALAQEQVTVENVGTAPLLVSWVNVRGTPEFTVVSEGCTRQPIRPREVCTIELGFAPRGSGTRRAQLVVSDNAADSPHTVPLSGRGMDVPPQVARARITPGSVDFGTTRPARSEGLQDFSRRQLRTSPQVRRVTVESVGAAPLAISSFNVRGPAGQEFIVVSQDCTRQPLTPGQSCSIDVRFAPHSSGARQAQLVISDNAADGPHTVPLSGTMVESSPAKSLGDREGIELIPKRRNDRGIVDVKPKPRGKQEGIDLKPKPQSDRGMIDVKPKSRDERRSIELEKPAPPPPPPVVR